VTFEIGRNEFKSSGFSDGFFKRAVTRACFCETGRNPDCRDALQTAAMTGPTTALARQQHALPAKSVLDQGRSVCMALCPTIAQLPLPLPAEMTVRLLIHVE